MADRDRPQSATQGAGDAAGGAAACMSRLDGDATGPPGISLATMEQATSLSAAAAVKMQLEAQKHRQVANHLEARGDIIGPIYERAEAARLECVADLALDLVVHTMGPVTVGNGGEMAIGSPAMSPFVDTVRERADMLAVDASCERMQLADNARALTLAIDAATTIQATNSVEKMLIHQMAAAHNAAMDQLAEGYELQNRYKYNPHLQHLSIEAGRRFNAAARMMDAY